MLLSSLSVPRNFALAALYVMFQLENSDNYLRKQQGINLDYKVPHRCTCTGYMDAVYMCNYLSKFRQSVVCAFIRVSTQVHINFTSLQISLLGDLLRSMLSWELTMLSRTHKAHAAEFCGT